MSSLYPVRAVDMKATLRNVLNHFTSVCIHAPLNRCIKLLHSKGPVNIYWVVGNGAFQIFSSKSMSYLKKQQKVDVISGLRMKKTCCPIIVLLKKSICPIAFCTGPNPPINIDWS